jgi:ankyrin repeat protein
MNAARSGCDTCVHLLLEHGADAKVRTNAGFTALHSAAFKGDLAMVKALLAAGAPVNVADDRGLTPLIMVANSRSKDPAVARLLLEHGADREAKDGFGRAAGVWAQIGGRQEIIGMLPEQAADEVAKTFAELVPADIRAAVAKSVTLLENTAPKFFPKTGCSLALTRVRYSME